MLYNSFVKIDNDIFSVSTNNYSGKIGRVVGKYPARCELDNHLYCICFENGERKNFFIWQFSVVNLSES